MLKKGHTSAFNPVFSSDEYSDYIDKQNAANRVSDNHLASLSSVTAFDRPNATPQPCHSEGGRSPTVGVYVLSVTPRRAKHDVGVSTPQTVIASRVQRGVAISFADEILTSACGLLRMTREGNETCMSRASTLLGVTDNTETPTVALRAPRSDRAGTAVCQSKAVTDDKAAKWLSETRFAAFCLSI